MSKWTAGAADGPLSRLSASVLLVTRDHRSLLPVVMAPLLSDPATDEIVVVVDGSRDGSVELLAAMGCADQRVRTIYVPGGGPSRALRTGALQAVGDVLVIVDDDTAVQHGSVSGHLRHHTAEGGLVVVGYLEVDAPRGGRPLDFRRYRTAREYEQDAARWEANPARILADLPGGFLSMHRSDYLRVVGAPGAVPSGYRELGARCAASGLRAVFDPTLRAKRLAEGGIATPTAEAIDRSDVLEDPTPAAPRSAARGRSR